MNEWDDFSDSDYSSEDGGTTKQDNQPEDQPPARSNGDRFGNSDSQYERRPNNYNDQNSRPQYNSRNSRGGGGGGRGPRNPRSFGKEEILNSVDPNSEDPLCWLNVFNVDEKVEEKDILEFYKSIPAAKAIRHYHGKASVDVGFKSIKELEAAIDLGTSSLYEQEFFIRTSNFLKI